MRQRGWPIRSGTRRLASALGSDHAHIRAPSKDLARGYLGDYRIEIIETKTSPRPGHRSIGVARNLTEQTWYATSYHLNFVEVPKDLVASHRKGEPTLVTLELKDGKVLVTALR